MKPDLGGSIRVLSGEERGQLTSKNLGRDYYTRFDRLAQFVAASSGYHPAAVRADRRDLAVMLAGPVADMAFEQEAMLLHQPVDARKIDRGQTVGSPLALEERGDLPVAGGRSRAGRCRLHGRQRRTVGPAAG